MTTVSPERECFFTVAKLLVISLGKLRKMVGAKDGTVGMGIMVEVLDFWPKIANLCLSPLVSLHFEDPRTGT